MCIRDSYDSMTPEQRAAHNYVVTPAVAFKYPGGVGVDIPAAGALLPGMSKSDEPAPPSSQPISYDELKQAEAGQ